MYTSSHDGMKDEGFWDVLRKEERSWKKKKKKIFFAEVGRKQEMWKSWFNIDWIYKMRKIKRKVLKAYMN